MFLSEIPLTTGVEANEEELFSTVIEIDDTPKLGCSTSIAIIKLCPSQLDAGIRLNGIPRICDGATTIASGPTYVQPLGSPVN